MLCVLYIQLGVDWMILKPAGVVGGGALGKEMLYVNWFEVI